MRNSSFKQVLNATPALFPEKKAALLQNKNNQKYF